jgi:hypothetical protein
MDPLPPLIGLAIIASGWVYMFRRETVSAPGTLHCAGR